MLMNGIATSFSGGSYRGRKGVDGVRTFDTQAGRSLRYGRQGVLDLDQLSAG